MPDLKQQVGDYLDHVVQRVDVDDVAERRLGHGQVRPVEPRRVAPTRTRWAYSVAAAVIVLVVVGAMLWLSGSTGESDVVNQPSSSVVPEGDVPMTTAPTTVATSSTTGFSSTTEPTSAPIPADPTSVFGFPVAEPIRNKVGFDITDTLLFIAEYIQAIEQGTPEPLFDTSSLGVEEVLTSSEPIETEGGSTPSSDSERPSEQVTLWAVALEGADVFGQFGVFLEYPAQGETPEYDANIEFGFNLSGSSGGLDELQLPESLGLLLVSDAGQGSATGIAGLPPQAAVVATVYGDGARVWQRPLFGMALFNDATRVCQPEPFEGQGCAPMEILVLDALGTELLRIMTPISESEHRFKITLPSGETYVRN